MAIFNLSETNSGGGGGTLYNIAKSGSVGILSIRDFETTLTQEEAGTIIVVTYARGTATVTAGGDTLNPIKSLYDMIFYDFYEMPSSDITVTWSRD